MWKGGCFVPFSFNTQSVRTLISGSVQKCFPEKVKYEAVDETCQADFIIATPGGTKVHDCIANVFFELKGR